jgi:FtsP/CotA-like multicopper oxidase with cupredoxin domain
VRIGQVVRVMLRPVFAGLWMAHCHILPHSDRGMMTLLRVDSPP